jgi:hypothetical protein
VWQVAFDKHDIKTLTIPRVVITYGPCPHCLSERNPRQHRYGEAILVALKLKAERQLEVIAPGQQDNLLVLCRLMLDIQAVQEKLSRERWRLSVCR